MWQNLLYCFFNSLTTNAHLIIWEGHWLLVLSYPGEWEPVNNELRGLLLIAQFKPNILTIQKPVH